MGSNYYSFLNCTVYKARTSRNNFRPLRSAPLPLVSALFPFYPVFPQPVFYFYTRLHTLETEGGFTLSPALKLSDDDSLDRIDFIRFSSLKLLRLRRGRLHLWHRLLVTVFSLSLSLSLTAASSLVIRDKETTTDIVRSRNGWGGSYESRKRVILLCSFLCNFSGSKNISLFFRKEIFRQIFVSNSYLVI